MASTLKTARNLNIAILVLSIIGIVGCVLLFGLGVVMSSSFTTYNSDYATLGTGILSIVIAIIMAISYIFSLVAVGIVNSGISKQNVAGGPFVMSILNAVFCGMAGRWITMILAIILSVKLNAAKKESLPNI